MSEVLLFLPILITVISGSIGIYLKVSEDKRVVFQVGLLLLILASGSVSAVQAYKKLQADERNKAYESATTIALDKPFEIAMLAIGIREEYVQDTDLGADRLAGYLVPVKQESSRAGSLYVYGEGLGAREFELSSCGPYLAVSEVSGQTTQSYLTVDFVEDKYSGLPCVATLRHGRRSSPDEQGDHWVFDLVAGATGHVVDVNTGESAGLILRAAQAKTLVKIEIADVDNPAAYMEHLRSNVEFELKFYQKLTHESPIGEGCQPVYKIALNAEFAVKEKQVSAALRPVDKGDFLVCENSPI